MPGPGEPGPVPPANLTDHFALFAPIITPDKQAFGILEVFQQPNPGAERLTRGLKEAFDPYHVLNPGRMYASI